MQWYNILCADIKTASRLKSQSDYDYKKFLKLFKLKPVRFSRIRLVAILISDT